MTDAISIKIPRPISSITLSENKDGQISVNSSASAQAVLKSKQNKLDSLGQALVNAVDELERFKGDILNHARQQVASLAIEIAAMVISEKVESNNYDIEKIIAEALIISPEKTDAQIHLHPQDFTEAKSLLEKNPQTPIAMLKLICDASIPKAGCKISSSKGIVESSVQNKLEHMAAAIKTALN